ncbi:nucleoside hydrolase [Oscillibacter sp. MSJ-2]|uniref:Nucleoside hydrolase n=1 Tax=Dysosmobacter acutus TaxID=2841504 RepID=A0ABS6F8K9_9FIRM|nr:nucleoside hydrolase [Dysosmobacter acutus]MBU5626628.1 nucleoside hydrolase [Dysosmobacter acutus]
MRKLILDVDTGSDDAIAIMLAVLSGAFDLLGITVCWGNRPVEACAQNTLQVAELLGSDVPVYQGCPEPMVRHLLPARHIPNDVSIIKDGVEYTIHPAAMPLPPARGRVQSKHAVSFLVETLMAAQEPVTLVAVGPPTNLGMAFRMEPRIRDHVAEVVFMGGAVDMGNVTPVAEANFFHDPEAAKIVLDSGVKVTCITLNATMASPFTLAEADELEALGTASGAFAADLIRIRAEASRHLGWSDGTLEPVHDPLAIAYLLNPAVITDLRRQQCNIDISGGFADGMLIVEHRNENDRSVNTYVSYGSDCALYHRMVKEAMAKGPKA